MPEGARPAHARAANDSALAAKGRTARTDAERVAVSAQLRVPIAGADQIAPAATAADFFRAAAAMAVYLYSGIWRGLTWR